MLVQHVIMVIIQKNFAIIVVIASGVVFAKIGNNLYNKANKQTYAFVNMDDANAGCVNSDVND